MYDQLIQHLQHLHLSADLATYIAFLVILVGVSIITLLINWILKNYIIRLVHKFTAKTSKVVGPLLNKHHVFGKLSQLGAAVFFSLAIPVVAYKSLPFTADLVDILRSLAVVYALIIIMLTFSRVLDAVHSYSDNVSYLRNKPVRSYLQILKIIAWVLTTICAISLMMGKSPMVFLTGLGAISAVTMLVFKDTILGFVASLQVSAYDSVRVGDWITIAGKNVDGNVIDVAVNTVKIRNFDNTVITIPTYDLVTSSVQNWRGMTESGGRRIKRSILIDIDTVKFCDKPLLTKLSKLHFLTKYLDERWEEIETFNAEEGVDKSLPANGRELTNVGLFRAYIDAYLQKNEHIHKGMTFLIRQLQPTSTGLPLELYVFTNDTDWIKYEGIQSDIFDHLLATLPVFELRAFQFSAGSTQPYAAEQVLQ
jgi:miniconductance mechanosensitive channel